MSSDNTLRNSFASSFKMGREPLNSRSVSNSERIATEMERPALDNRSYRVIRLPNQLEALLIHDSETDKASAALDVNVGSFSDAEDMPGIAHAVEHMLFMGTEKYPRENAYNQYLTSHSGHSNAFTASTSTNYYFEVATSSSPSSSKASSREGSRKSSVAGSAVDLNSSKSESPLYGALDRFAQFFIAPLFLEDTLEREMRAVDSENKKNLQSDNWRLHQLNKSLSNPKHPFNHFSTGSYETLRDGPIARGVKIRDEFIKFYQTHYSANRMKLVVLGRESLDELESWVEELFSAVPNKNLPQNRWDAINPYTHNELMMQVFAKPVFDMRVLDIHFQYQDEEELYESKPGRYLSHLIGHEGPGSILAYLKNKGWANGLGAGPSPLCPGSAFFTISVRLTEDGLAHYQEVTEVIFQYIAMLKDNLPQKWIFEEIKSMSEVDFRFKQKSPASRTTSALSGTMQKCYPRDCLLSGPNLVRKYDPESIMRGLSCLRPDNCRLTIVSQEYPGVWNKREKWYGTEYKYERIPKYFVEDIQAAARSTAAERPPELHLPHRNEFIPTRLEVEKKEAEHPAVAPKLIRHDDSVRTWFKKDDRFWVPKANLHVTLRTPLANMTPQTVVMANLYRELVQDALNEYSYDAEISGLDYSISNHSLGLDVSVNGYNDKMAVLLEKVLLSMRDLDVRADRFAIIKERMNRGYKNWEFQQPYHQVGTVTRWLSTDKGWINEQYVAELPHITVEDVRAFFPQLLRQCHIEVLAHGNLHKEDALRFTDLIETTLQPRKLPPSQWPIRRALLLPEGANYIYERTLKDPANVNHCIEYMIFVGRNEDRNLRAQLLLLSQVADEPCFDQLRTKEQLGYVVFSGVILHLNMVGYRILVQSEKKPEFLEQRIEEFLTTRLGTVLKQLDATQFEKHKTSLINKRLERLKNLTQESNRFWNHILSEAYDFEQAEHDATHITPVTKADLISFYERYISPNSEHRAKASVHLIAQATPATIAAQMPRTERLDKIIALAEKLLTTCGIFADADALRDRFEKVEIKDVNTLSDTLITYLVEDEGMGKEGAKLLVEKTRPVIGSGLTSIGIETTSNASANEDALAALNGESGAGSGGNVQKAPQRSPTYITDVHTFKASLLAGSGPKAVRDLAEFEDLEAKL